jgi:hypothetical protein
MQRQTETGDVAVEVGEAALAMFEAGEVADA